MQPLRREDVTGQETWRYSDYRHDLGWKIPGKIHVTLGGGMTDTYEVTALRPAISPTSWLK